MTKTGPSVPEAIAPGWTGRCQVGPKGGIVFVDFFYELRNRGLKVGLNEWLALMEALGLGLHRSSLTGFYNVARSILARSEADFDAFDQAFSSFFKGIEIESADLTKELLDWLENPASWVEDLDPEMLRRIEEMDLDELRRLFEERLKEQDARHDGGNRWVGTGGTSPFGWGGRRRGGVRVAGRGMWGSAMQVAGARLYREYRKDVVLDVRQIQVALRKLRELTREGAREELDVDATIDQTCRNAGELELVWRARRKNAVKVLLLMDVGGSMNPHARLVSRLFTAASKSNHFKDFQYYYFHNCVYDTLYETARFSDPISLGDLLGATTKDYKLVLVGDARMHPVELFRPGGAIHYWEWNPRPGIDSLSELAHHFRRSVWLNPTMPSLWGHITVKAVRSLFTMFPLTLEGLEDAVQALVAGPGDLRADKAVSARGSAF